MNEQEKKKIGVIGEEEFTVGFKLVGVQKIFDTDNYTEKMQDLINREDIGILIVNEDDLERLPKRARKQVEMSVDPVVVALSESAEATNIQEKIKRVIGVDLSQ